FVRVPAGDHRLRLRFNLDGYFRGLSVSDVVFSPLPMITITPPGIATLEPAQDGYEPGTAVTITPVDCPDCTVIGWTGDVESDESVLNVVVNESLSLRPITAKNGSLQVKNQRWHYEGDFRWTSSANRLLRISKSSSAQGQTSTVRRAVEGPAVFTFSTDWWSSSGIGDLVLQIDGETVLEFNGTSRTYQIPIEAGTHEIAFVATVGTSGIGVHIEDPEVTPGYLLEVRSTAGGEVVSEAPNTLAPGSDFTVQAVPDEGNDLWSWPEELTDPPAETSLTADRHRQWMFAFGFPRDLFGAEWRLGENEDGQNQPATWLPGYSSNAEIILEPNFGDLPQDARAIAEGIFAEPGVLEFTATAVEARLEVSAPEQPRITAFSQNRFRRTVPGRLLVNSGDPVRFEAFRYDAHYGAASLEAITFAPGVEVTATVTNGELLEPVPPGLFAFGERLTLTAVPDDNAPAGTTGDVRWYRIDQVDLTETLLAEGASLDLELREHLQLRAEFGVRAFGYEWFTWLADPLWTENWELDAETGELDTGWVGGGVIRPASATSTTVEGPLNLLLVFGWDSEVEIYLDGERVVADAGSEERIAIPPGPHELALRASPSESARLVYFGPDNGFSVRVRVDGEGDVLRSQEGLVPAGESLTLTAEPAEGWVFTGWSHGLGDEPMLTITPDDHWQVTADFRQQSTLQAFGRDWTTTGREPWRFRRGALEAGSRAARSGESTWAETTVEGPGVLSFNWRIAYPSSGGGTVGVIGIATGSGSVSIGGSFDSLGQNVTSVQSVDDATIQRSSTPMALAQAVAAEPPLPEDVETLSLELNGDRIASLAGASAERQTFLLEEGTHQLRFVYREFDGGPNHTAEAFIGGFSFTPGYATTVAARPEEIDWEPDMGFQAVDGLPSAVFPAGTELTLSYLPSDAGSFLEWSGDLSSAESTLSFAADRHRQLTPRRQLPIEFGGLSWTFTGSGRVVANAETFTWNDPFSDEIANLETTVTGPGILRFTVDTAERDLVVELDGTPQDLATHYRLRVPPGDHALRLSLRPRIADSFVALSYASWQPGVSLQAAAERGSVRISPSRASYQTGDTVVLDIDRLQAGDRVAWYEGVGPDFGGPSLANPLRVTLENHSIYTAIVSPVAEFDGRDWFLSHLDDWDRADPGEPVVTVPFPATAQPSLTAVLEGPGILDLTASLLWLDNAGSGAGSVPRGSPGRLRIFIGDVEAFPLDLPGSHANYRYRIPEGEQAVHIVYTPPSDHQGALWIEQIRYQSIPAGRIPEWWLREHFSDSEWIEMDVSGDDRDPDQDGSSNWREFIFADNPVRPNMRSSMSVRAENRGMRISYRRPSGEAHATYAVEFSEDLHHWEEHPELVQSIEVSDDGPHTDWVTVSLRDATEQSSLPRFIRIIARPINR
ncbi:MAG: hypothetical protein ACFB21_10140, partial [Opitutales bacterium]